MKKVLGVDLDDVLIRSGEALARFHNTKYGSAYTNDDVKDFDLSIIWNCTHAEAQERIDEFMDSDFHHEAEPVLGAYDALALLSKTYDIVVVTGRRDIARKSTENWLEKHFLGLYRELHFTSSHDPDRQKRVLKSEIVRNLGISVFIDDALPFAKDVASLGIPVLLFDTPWNRSETPPGTERVYSWEEILQKLL